jgi:hypothetical protein
MACARVSRYHHTRPGQKIKSVLYDMITTNQITHHFSEKIPMDVDKHKLVIIDYTNYKGERREHKFCTSPFHSGEEQWFMFARDIETTLYRMFAMKDIHSWKPKS